MAPAVVSVWLVVGLIGAWTYGHHYYLYRGFPRPKDPAGVSRGRLVAVRFFSPALGSRREYTIYLPAGYSRAASRGRRFPVLYLLHGSPAQPSEFVEAGDLAVAADVAFSRRHVPPFLIVIPDGRDGTYASDTEWADRPHGRYSSFVLDTVRAVDARWATLPDRHDRAIGGLSEGAYGAMNVALHNLRVFGAVEAWSGYYTQTPTGPFSGASRAELAANSPAEYVPALAAQLRALPLRAFIYGGAQDPDTLQLVPFATQLRAAGARVVARIYPGRHDWRLWRGQMPHMLAWTGQTFAGARSRMTHGGLHTASQPDGPRRPA
jgi:S-formylglutathione hydrolase FrmB